MTATWISDLTQCVPDSAISESSSGNNWRSIEYESGVVKGVLLSANPGAPELKLRLAVNGWHAIYVGLWGRDALRLKLTSDSCFTRLLPEFEGRAGETICDGFFKFENLSGQDLVISADSRGPFGGNPTWSSIAYVRCEPLTKSQLRTIKEDCEKILIATNDGECVTHCKSEDDIKEFIEPFRDSDFGDVYWGIVGEFATHPTAIGIERYRKFDPDSGGSELARKGINAMKVAMDHAHRIGVGFHVYQRMGAFGSVPPIKGNDGFYDELFTGKFYQDHPEWRCVDKEGRAMFRMSYAYAGVREFSIAILSEMASYGVDGLNLQFKRGAPFVMYEDPLVDGFRSETGLDARNLDEWDESWLRYRYWPLTEYVKSLREELDRIGNRIGKKIQLSVTSFPSKDENLFFGLDLKTWVDNGLIDVLTPMSWSHSSRQVQMDYYAGLTKGTKCMLKPFLSVPKDNDERNFGSFEYRKEALCLYESGADGLVFWDDHCQGSDTGQTKKRLGNVEKLRNWDQRRIDDNQFRVIRLSSLGGYSLLNSSIPVDHRRIYNSTIPYWFLPL